MTKLYLHAASSIISNLPTTEQSALTSAKDGDAQTVNRSMNSTIGTAQSSITLTTNASSSQQDIYFSKWVSPFLNQSGISANTWNYAFAGNEANANANFPVGSTNAPVYVNVYVWRPSNQTKVGTILDGNTASVFAEVSATGTEKSMYGTFTGSAVAGAAVGDVIVFEMWFRITQGNATARADLIYFDGTTETNAVNTTVSNHASFIETPESLTFKPTTKLYFHQDGWQITGTLPSIEQSTLASNSDAESQATNRGMGITIGIGQASIALTSVNTVSAQNYYFTRFVSQPLNQSGIVASIWNYSMATKESNASANFPVSSTLKSVYVNCYVWRPSGGGSVVGTILDGITSATYSEGAANTEVSQFGTFVGAAIAGAAAGDVIVCEIWFQITQAAATAYTDTIYFDGTTETNTTGTTVANHASYIETSEALVFTSVQAAKIRSITETVSISGSPTLSYTPAGDQVFAKQDILTLDTTSGAHTQSFSGFGGQPKAIWIYGTGTVDTNPTDGGCMSIGMSDGTTSACMAFATQDNVSPAVCRGQARNDAVLSIADPSDPTTELVRASVTFDSDGITLTYALKDTVQYIFHFLAIWGNDVSVYVKADTVGRTGTGSASYSGAGFTPKAIFAMVFGDANMNSLIAGGCVGIGLAKSTTQQSVIAFSCYDTVSSTVARSFSDATRCLIARNNSDINTAVASLTSMDSDGWTVNYTTAPIASTQPLFWMALKCPVELAAFSSPTSTGNLTNSFLTGLDPVGVLVLGPIGTGSEGTGVSPLRFSIGSSDGTNQGAASLSMDKISSLTAPVRGITTSKCVQTFPAQANGTTATPDVAATIGDMDTRGQYTENYNPANSSYRISRYFIFGQGTSTGQHINKALPTESTTISESLDRLLAKIRASIESNSISETPTRLLTKVRGLVTESNSISATIARIKGKVTGITENVAKSESIGRLLHKFRTNIETVAKSETLARKNEKLRVLATETITKSESIARLLNKSRTAIETISITESIARRLAKFRILATQTTTASESIDKLVLHGVKNIVKTLTETLSISDLVDKIKGVMRTQTESITISSTLARLLSKIRTASDTSAIGSTLTRQKPIVRTLSTQSISISDLLDRLKSVQRICTDSIIIQAGTLNRLLTKVRTIQTQSVIIAESVDRVKSGVKAIARTIVETIDITESLARLLHKFRVNIETINKDETLARKNAKARSLPLETVAKSESMTRLISKVRTASETVVVLDSIARLLHKFRINIETVTKGETLASKKSKLKTLIENVGKGETLAKLVGKARIVIESVSISDTLSRLLSKIRARTETVSITDIVARFTGQVHDVVRIIEEPDIIISDAFIKARQLVEDVNVGDFLGKLVTHFSPVNILKTVTDSVIVGLDSVIRRSGKKQSIVESSIATLDGTEIFHRAKVRKRTETVKITSSVSVINGKRTITLGLNESVVAGEANNRQLGKVRRIGGLG